MDAKLPNLVTDLRFLDVGSTFGVAAHLSLLSTVQWHVPAFQLPHPGCWRFTNSDGLTAVREEQELGDVLDVQLLPVQDAPARSEVEPVDAGPNRSAHQVATFVNPQNLCSLPTAAVAFGLCSLPWAPKPWHPQFHAHFDLLALPIAPIIGLMRYVRKYIFWVLDTASVCIIINFCAVDLQIRSAAGCFKDIWSQHT